MLVANRVDGDDGFLNQELELGVGIVDVRVVDALDKCFSCIGSLQTAGSLDLEDADIVDTSCFAQCVVVDKYVTGCNAKPGESISNTSFCIGCWTTTKYCPL